MFEWLHKNMLGQQTISFKKLKTRVIQSLRLLKWCLRSKGESHTPTDTHTHTENNKHYKVWRDDLFYVNSECPTHKGRL